MSSCTSMLLGHISAYRNSEATAHTYHLGKVVLAEIVYIAIVPFAIVEAAISQVVKAIAKCVVINPNKYEMINSWATSSAYGALWAIMCAIGNLCNRGRIIATEEEFLASPLFKKPTLTPDPFVPERPRPPLPPRGLGVDPGRQEPFVPWFNPWQRGIFNPRPAPTRPADTNPLNPPTVEPAVADLLKNYELAENAKKHTDIFEAIYRDLPEPKYEEIDSFSVELVIFLEDRIDNSYGFNMMHDLEDIARSNQRSPEDDHYIKMLLCSYETIMKNNEPSEIEIMKQAFVDANGACRTRRNDEIQRLFLSYVAPRLNTPFLNGLTPLDCLIFDLMQYRIKLRDNILNITGRNDTHDHTYFCRRLNESTFHLPFPSLSVDEHRNPNHFKREEELLIKTFRHCYDSPNTLYTVFTGLLYPKRGEVFKYKPEMFADWLKEKGKMNLDDAFEDDMYPTNKPPLVIDYLEELGIFKKN